MVHCKAPKLPSNCLSVFRVMYGTSSALLRFYLARLTSRKREANANKILNSITKQLTYPVTTVAFLRRRVRVSFVITRLHSDSRRTSSALFLLRRKGAKFRPTNTPFTGFNMQAFKRDARKGQTESKRKVKSSGEHKKFRKRTVKEERKNAVVVTTTVKKYRTSFVVAVYKSWRRRPRTHAHTHTRTHAQTNAGEHTCMHIHWRMPKQNVLNKHAVIC